MDGVTRETTGGAPAVGAEGVGPIAAEEVAGEAGHGARIAEDAARVERAATLFASLATDPTVALQVAQTWIRDLSGETRESAAVGAEERGRLQQLLAEAQREAERAARDSAANAGEVGRIFGWIGAGLAVIGGIVGAAFTGGASVALAVAALVLVVGSQVTTELARAGVIDDPNVAAGVSLTCSILATICSLGASSAGAVTNTVTTVIQVAASAAQAAGGIADGTAAVCAHDGDRAEAGALAHLLARDDARGEAEGEVDALGSLMRAAGRMARLAAEAREARTAGLRAAVGALRG